MLKADSKADYGSFAREEATSSTAPPRHATWTTASQLIVADVIGIGVMAMAEAFAELGWVLGISACLAMLPLNVYCGICCWESQVEIFPNTYTIADLGRASLGSGGYWFTGSVVYSFLFFVLGEYVLSLGMCLEQLGASFGVTHISRHLWSFWGALVLLPFCQIRTLNGTRWLLWINTATIVLSVGLSLGHLVAGGEVNGPTAPTALVATDLSWRSLTSGLSKFAFAYVGVILYPEITSEMAEPRDFPKALYAGAPFQLVSFMTVGCIGYAYLGAAANGILINVIPPGPLSSATTLCLFVHLLITYLIKGTVLARACHRLVSPATTNDYGRDGTLVWLAVTTAILVTCLGVASAVPFFGDLTSLLGSLQTPVGGFCLPVLFLLSGYGLLGGASVEERGLVVRKQASWWLPLVLWGIFAFGAVFCLVGTVATSLNIIDRWHATLSDGTGVYVRAAERKQDRGLGPLHIYQ